MAEKYAATEMEGLDAGRYSITLACHFNHIMYRLTKFRK